MKIHQVSDGNGSSGKNRFCGPSAISILTGMTTGEAARLLRNISGRKQITGTGTGEVYKALALCNVRMRTVIIQPGLTLAGWLKDTVKERTPGRVWLVVAGNHWQVITGRRYACGRIREIVSIKDKRVKRRARVTEVYEISVLSGKKVVIPDRAKPSRTDSVIRNINARIAADFRKFARQHKLDYRIYPESGLKYIEVQPTELWPLGLETIHYSYEETKGRLQTCLDDPSLVVDGYYSE